MEMEELNNNNNFTSEYHKLNIIPHFFSEVSRVKETFNSRAHLNFCGFRPKHFRDKFGSQSSCEVKF